MRPCGTPHPQFVGKCYQNGLVAILGILRHVLKTFLTGSIFTIWGGCAIWSQYKEIFQNFENFEEFKNDATICLKSLPNRFGSIFPTFWGGVCHMVAIQGDFSKFRKH